MQITENTLVPVSQDMLEEAEPLVGGAIQFIESLLEKITEDSEAVKNRIIATPQDSAQVTMMVKRLKFNKKQLEDERMEVSGVHRRRADQVNAFFKNFTTAIDEGVKIGTDNIGAYIQEQQRIADEKAKLERERVQREADERAAELKKKADEAIEVAADDDYDKEGRDRAMADAEDAEAEANAIQAAPVEAEVVMSRGTGATASVTYGYSAKIVDVTAIPEYILDVPAVMTAITKELNSIAKKRKETFKVPGAELVKTPKTNIR